MNPLYSLHPASITSEHQYSLFIHVSFESLWCLLFCVLFILMAYTPFLIDTGNISNKKPPWEWEGSRERPPVLDKMLPDYDSGSEEPPQASGVPCPQWHITSMGLTEAWHLHHTLETLETDVNQQDLVTDFEARQTEQQFQICVWVTKEELVSWTVMGQ